MCVCARVSVCVCARLSVCVCVHGDFKVWEEHALLPGLIHVVGTSSGLCLCLHQTERYVESKTVLCAHNPLLWPLGNVKVFVPQLFAATVWQCPQ